MSKPRLLYFDAPVSRGEECRMALWLAGVDFDDVRIKIAEWPEQKATAPYGALPVLEIPGKPAIAHSNAILTLIGRKHDLHPTDAFDAASHEAMMCYVEDLRAKVSPTLRIKDAEEKRKAREELAAGFLPEWGANVERHLGDGPFFAGAKLHVVDLKLYMAVRWFAGGAVDHVPATIFSSFPKLNRLFEAVGAEPRIKAWQARG